MTTNTVGGIAPDAVRLTWNPGSGTYSPPNSAEVPAARRFIKGPLPLPWLQRAAALPGKAFHVAIGLWYVSGLCRSDTFLFKRSVAADFGVSPDATYDALTNLEAAGLVNVARHRGRSPNVTILEATVPNDRAAAQRHCRLPQARSS
jgi:hypothetical protein